MKIRVIAEGVAVTYSNVKDWVDTANGNLWIYYNENGRNIKVGWAAGSWEMIRIEED